jgi:hypothetical protein
MGKKARIKQERKNAWEQDFIKNKKIKSNTPIVFIPTLILLTSIVLIHVYADISKNQYRALFFIMFGYLFIGTPIAQIRSGYLWKNLADGNRGKHKSEAPLNFAISNIIYTIIGLCFWLYSATCLFSNKI